MANIKSAKKRILTSAKKAEANKAVKTGVNNADGEAMVAKLKEAGASAELK